MRDIEQPRLADYTGSDPKLTWSEWPWGYNPLSERAQNRVLGLRSMALRRYLTPKARASSMLGVFPSNERTHQEVLDPRKIDKLRDRASRIVKSGLSAAIRTCYKSSHLGRAPWVMGLDSAEMVERFFADKAAESKGDDWSGFKGNYRSLLESIDAKVIDISEVILMGNPRWVGEQSNFVAVFGFMGSDSVSAEAVLGTHQIRALDKVHTSNLITISTQMAKKDGMDPYGLHAQNSDLSLKIGRRYLNEVGRRTFSSDNNTSFVEWNWTRDKEAVVETVDPWAVNFVGQIVSRFFDGWLRGYRRYDLLALDNVGLGLVEFQGNMKRNGKISDLVIYGLRGPAES